MSHNSCLCPQKYNVPKEEEEEEEKLEEIIEEQYSEESPPTSPKSIKTEPYDTVNFIPSLEDLFVLSNEMSELEFNDLLFIRKRMNHRVVGAITTLVESVNDEALFVGIRGFFPASKKIHLAYCFGYIKLNYDLANEIRREEHMDMLINSTERLRCHVFQNENEGVYNVSFQTDKDDKEIIKNYNDLSYDDFVDVLTESANIILLRQMARKDFVGTKHLKYVYVNNEICDMEYKSYDFKFCNLNKGFAEVKRVRRRIIMPNRELVECNAFLSRNGQLILLSWRGEKHYAAIDRKALIREGFVPKEPIENIPLKERIEDNPFLKSILEESTVKCILKGNLYIADHPEVKSILSFISKELLLHKPHKVVHYVRRCIAPYL